MNLRCSVRIGLLAIVFAILSAPIPAAELLPLPSPAKKLSELQFKYESFTFVRIKYSHRGARGAGRGGWTTDYPDAEINFSRRFTDSTGLRTESDGKVLGLTDPALKNYPFAYMAEGGSLALSEAEVVALRNYLSNGGFLMVDDFWGEAEWRSLAEEMKRVFPELQPVDLPLEHPLFHCFYDIPVKPQVPNLMVGILSEKTGVTWEREDAKEPHYRALVDSKGRVMALFCHNTDLGDGWERERDNAFYAREFSIKKAFPMGINIVVYALSR